MLGDYRHLQRHVRVDGTDGENAIRQDPRAICGYVRARMLDVCDDLVVHPQAQRDGEHPSVEMKGTTNTTRIESCSALVIPDRGQKNRKQMSRAYPLLALSLDMR
jgi:hypothetical protein